MQQPVPWGAPGSPAETGMLQGPSLPNSEEADVDDKIFLTLEFEQGERKMKNLADARTASAAALCKDKVSSKKN